MAEAPAAPDGKNATAAPSLQKKLPVATSGQQHKVFSRVLEMLALTREEAGGLAEQRGLVKERVDALKFGRLPGKGKRRREILGALESEFDAGLLATIPGIVVKDGSLDFALSGSGLIIPHCDLSGNIVGLQVRLDREPKKGTRYLWLSGNGGPSVDAAPYLAGDTAIGGQALLTEGAFKALAASDRLGMVSIGLSGASMLSQALPVLKEMGAKDVLVAYDADHAELKPDGKPNQVFGWLRSAVRNLRAEGYTVRLLVWHRGLFVDGETPKGVDDAIRSGAELRELEGDQVDAHLRDVASLLGLETPSEPASQTQEDDRTSVFSRALSKAEELFEFFADNGIAYLSPGNGTAVALEGSSARKQLVLRLYRAMGRAPSAETVQKILDVKSAEVTLEGPSRPVFRRVGEQDGVHYLDLCRVDGTVAEITAEGWKLVKAPPGVYFRRSASADEALPDPIRGGDVMLLAKLLNAPQQAIKFMVGYLVAALRTGRPYPLLVFEGSAGAAKTSATKILKFLVDPERAMVSSLPRNEQDLAIACYSSHLLVIDNVDKLKPEQQDALCRVATGAHHKARKLYADSEQTALDMHAPVVMSGIDGLVDRADLGSRVALVTLDGIPENERITEDELWERVRRHRPFILGGILDAFVAGLANLAKVHLPRRPRMVDFAQFVTAAECGLPWKPGEVLAFFLSSQANLYEQAIGKDRVALAIIRLMQYRNEWTGTVADLLGSLAPPTGGEDYWPNTPHKLGRRVKQALPLLEARGIGFRQPPRSKHGILFSFYIKEVESALNTPASRNPDEIRVLGGELSGELKPLEYTKYTAPLASPYSNGGSSPETLAAQLELEEREDRRALQALAAEDIPL